MTTVSTPARTWQARVPSQVIQSNLSAKAKVTYMALALHADTKGECFPSKDVLAKEASLSERSVHTALRELEAAGQIEIISRGRRNGSQTTNVYRLALPATVAVRQEVQDEIVDLPATRAPQGVQEVHPLPATVAPPSGNTCTPITAPSNYSKKNSTTTNKTDAREASSPGGSSPRTITIRKKGDEAVPATGSSGTRSSGQTARPKKRKVNQGTLATVAPGDEYDLAKVNSVLAWLSENGPLSWYEGDAVPGTKEFGAGWYVVRETLDKLDRIRETWRSKGEDSQATLAVLDPTPVTQAELDAIRPKTVAEFLAS